MVAICKRNPINPYMNTIDLSGKVAVVTGGSRGLGLAITRGLSRAGATVAVASRKLETCVQVVDLAFEMGVLLLEVMSVTAREPMCLVIGLERLG